MAMTHRWRGRQKEREWERRDGRFNRVPDNGGDNVGSFGDEEQSDTGGRNRGTEAIKIDTGREREKERKSGRWLQL
jgi:hypothetical protein